MSLWVALLIIFLAGAVGGVVNALISDNGFILPRTEETGGNSIIRPGFLGNILTGGVAACVSWGLYGPFAAVYIAGGPTSPAGSGGAAAGTPPNLDLAAKMATATPAGALRMAMTK